MKIPLMCLKRQYESIKPEIDETIAQILNNTSFIGGKEKDLFEQEFAAAIGTKYCVGVGNGTDAIFLVLKALGIGAGDEVVTSANSFIASSEAISMSGAKPVFLDAHPENFNLDLEALDLLLSKRAVSRGGLIKAILPVHLYGRIVDMEKLMALAEKYKVLVIEDSAQAHLAQLNGRGAGTFGVAATFSFYPGKNLGAYGDAGAIVTNDEKLALLVRKLANHGRVSKYDHDMEGYNSRLDTLQAAVLRVKLKKLKDWTAARQAKALIYDDLLSAYPHIQRPELPEAGQHVFHLYVVRTEKRDEIFNTMKAQGIECGIHYPIMLPALQAYAHMNHKPEDFPVANRLQKEILSLPLFPEITRAEQEYVVRCLVQSLGLEDSKALKADSHL